MAGTAATDDDVMVYTPEEAAERIGSVVSAAWLRRKAGRKEIPCSRLGKLGFTQKHLDEIVARFDSPARRRR
ncbi:hypothetical protein KDK95_27995 [Actinospica sp. MGRD01-02]|uniref:Uncharacterized protein n=1 Tax=Actinospica acidithermotolerans TaxID=2828514 RepID=A0A941EGW4_9ACTN|nr:hypothetical protein [Actinospica acidithermotolerans]MBR7830178.1 hypothetical protein [Actinospica acidithermotolerans]